MTVWYCAVKWSHGYGNGIHYLANGSHMAAQGVFANLREVSPSASMLQASLGCYCPTPKIHWQWWQV